jgi:signal transduction histidine kinase
MVSVSDTGVGLPADEIFDEFFTPKLQGMGMPLCRCQDYCGQG